MMTRPKDPLYFGKRLVGNLSSFYRFRIGDYRLLAHIDKDNKTVLIVAIGHRREIYKD